MGGRGASPLFEKVYGLGVRIARAAYRRGILPVHRLPVPVVSVGNLTWGGTGKTPLVIRLARHLVSAAARPAILTRGYGQDEVRLLRETLPEVPILVSPNRAESGSRAVREYGARLLLLDDGYQQWRIHKDLEILTVNAAAPFGNGRLIPAGTLREPSAEARRADWVVIKGAAGTAETQAAEAQVRAFNRRAPVLFMRYVPRRIRRWPGGEEMPLDGLRGKRVCALSGIGDPRSFEETLRSLNGRVVLSHRVRDHHVYTAGELIRLLDRCRRHRIEAVVTTAKDAVRVPELFMQTVGKDLRGVAVWVLDVEPVLEPDESELLHRIDSLLPR